MTVIQQGDQYLLEFSIKENNVAVTPSDVDDVRIQVGSYLKSYVKNEITYSNSKWYYPLKQEETLKYEGSIIDIQVGLKKDGVLHYSVVIPTLFNKSIIKEVW